MPNISITIWHAHNLGVVIWSMGIGEMRYSVCRLIIAHVNRGKSKTGNGHGTRNEAFDYEIICNGRKQGFYSKV